MKLLSKYNRINIGAAIIALLFGSLSYYFIIRFVLIKQLDNALKIEEAEIRDFVREKNALPEPTSYRDQQIAFTASNTNFRRRFLHTRFASIPGGETAPYRQLIFPIVANGKLYRVSVTKSEVETEDLLLLIVLITVAVIMLLLIILFLANRFILKRVWQPFYQTLNAIGNFRLSNRTVIHPGKSGIDEFDYLDTALNTMTGKIVNDYEVLQRFADNASHEMQTPLAIINSKLDLLIQDQRLDENQLKPLQEIYDAMERLRKLNQSLLLLTKIENRQFIHAEYVQLRVHVTSKLQQMEEIFSTKHLQVVTELQDADIKLNTYLADILLNNLLSNAFHHNIENGIIEVGLIAGRLSISNTGPVLPFDSSGIFERFNKSDRSAGVGLGLAVVKQICESAGLEIDYTYTNSMHHFIILF